jgi:hypothetical protein
MEEDIKKRKDNFKNKWKTTSEIKYDLKHNLKKLTLIDCDIIVN